MSIEENCAKHFKEVNFEFMSSGTPQKTEAIEQGFASLYYQMCKMVAHVVLNENIKTGLCTKCVETVTKLEN